MRFGIGLLGATARLLVRDWGQSPRMWAASIAAGAAMPFIDTHDGLQCVLVRLLVAAGVALGFLQPRAPWRWAIALILGVTAAAQFSPFPGFIDRGDLTPTTLTALASVYLAAFLRRASALTGVLRRPT